MNDIYVIAIIIVSYIVGSIPTGYIIARLWGIQDIRSHGSGNIGATNVARILGSSFFIPIFVLDACKAYINICIISYIGYQESLIVIAALLHLVGNGCSIFLSGQGGKGVATSVGLIGALQPLLILPLCITWILSLLCTHIVGIASTISMIVLPLYTWLGGYSTDLLVFSCCMSGWVLLRHRTNIYNAVAYKS